MRCPVRPERGWDRSRCRRGRACGSDGLWGQGRNQATLKVLRTVLSHFSERVSLTLLVSGVTHPLGAPPGQRVQGHLLTTQHGQDGALMSCPHPQTQESVPRWTHLEKRLRLGCPQSHSAPQAGGRAVPVVRAAGTQAHTSCSTQSSPPARPPGSGPGKRAHSHPPLDPPLRGHASSRDFHHPGPTPCHRPQQLQV